MLDKTEDKQLARVSEDELAIGVQLSLTIGQTRTLTLTSGLPLNWPAGKLNSELDKLVALGDRQRAKHDLEQTRQLLKNEEQNLHLHRAQVSGQEMHFQTEFRDRGKQGEWRATGSQAQTLVNLKKNVENSEERIKKLRADIKEMESKCL